METTKLGDADHTCRVDTLVETYADIAEQAYGDFLDAVFDPEQLVGTSQFEEPVWLTDLYVKRQINGIKTIVFSAMAIEAAAFEYAAMSLGDQIAKKLDRMDLEGKWMIATRLACGRSLEADSPAINNLKSLVRARNDLVHHKSKPADSAGKAEQAMRTWWADFEKDQVSNAFKTLILLSLELDALPNNIIGALPYYGKDPFYDDPRHPGVKDAIDRCREIHRNNLKGD